MDEAAVYVIRVAGPVDPAPVGLRSTAAPDGATTGLVGRFADQGALLEALRALHAAGVPLLAVTRAGPAPSRRRPPRVRLTVLAVRPAGGAGAGGEATGSWRRAEPRPREGPRRAGARPPRPRGRPAGGRGRSRGPTPGPGPSGTGSPRTSSSHSPSRRSRAREVTSSFTRGAWRTRSQSTVAPSTRCSRLSSTSSRARSPRARASAGKGSPAPAGGDAQHAGDGPGDAPRRPAAARLTGGRMPASGHQEDPVREGGRVDLADRAGATARCPQRELGLAAAPQAHQAEHAAGRVGQAPLQALQLPRPTHQRHRLRGQVVRHRLNRGGNRDANRALHQLVIGRLGRDARTRAYVVRRTREGKSKKEIIRCLKRYAARELYRLLAAPADNRPAEPAAPSLQATREDRSSVDQAPPTPDAPGAPTARCPRSGVPTFPANVWPTTSEAPRLLDTA